MASPVVHEVHEASLAISCARLTKDYGEGHGLFDLDLQVAAWARCSASSARTVPGKTTTIRLLMDLIRPDRGARPRCWASIRARDSLAVKRRVGYLPGELAQLSRRDCPATSSGLLAGLRGGVDPARIASLADRFGLDLSRKYPRTSRTATSRRSAWLQAFMHDPSCCSSTNRRSVSTR